MRRMTWIKFDRLARSFLARHQRLIVNACPQAATRFQTIHLNYAIMSINSVLLCTTAGFRNPDFIILNLSVFIPMMTNLKLPYLASRDIVLGGVPTFIFSKNQ